MESAAAGWLTWTVGVAVPIEHVLQARISVWVIARPANRKSSILTPTCIELAAAASYPPTTKEAVPLMFWGAWATVTTAVPFRYPTMLARVGS